MGRWAWPSKISEKAAAPRILQHFVLLPWAVHQREGKAPDLCCWRLSSWKTTWLCILIAGPQRRDFQSPLPSPRRLPWNAPTPPNIVFLKPFGISYDYASLPLPLRLEAAFTSCYWNAQRALFASVQEYKQCRKLNHLSNHYFPKKKKKSLVVCVSSWSANLPCTPGRTNIILLRFKKHGFLVEGLTHIQLGCLKPCWLTPLNSILTHTHIALNDLCRTQHGTMKRAEHRWAITA